MDDAQFWRIVAEACRPDEVDEWDEHLHARLCKLPPDEIVAWGDIFERLTTRAYTVDLWGAAYLMIGTGSDDSFYYFRCWLVGMGRGVYEAAIADPDGLADLVDPGAEMRAEIYGAAQQAWEAVTEDLAGEYPHGEYRDAELAGEDWDFDDDEQVRRRLPRLAALYLND